MPIAANWKTVVDGFVEVYHLQGIHPQLLRFLDDVNTTYEVWGRHSAMYMPMGVPSPRLKAPDDDVTLRELSAKGSGYHGKVLRSSRYFREVDGKAELTDGVSVRQALIEAGRAEAEELGRDYSGLTDAQVADDHHYFFFPNVIMNIDAGHFIASRIRPHATDPEQCYFDMHVFDWLSPEQKAARPRAACRGRAGYRGRPGARPGLHRAAHRAARTALQRLRERAPVGPGVPRPGLPHQPRRVPVPRMTGALRERPGDVLAARDFALHRLAADTAQVSPDMLALLGPAGAVSYGELEARARRVAHALREDGVATGTRVAYLAEEVGRCLEVLIGTAQAGGVAVPVNWRLSAAEVAGILLDSQAPVLVTTADFFAALTREPEALTGVRLVVLLDEQAAAAPPAGADVRVIGYEEWTADRPSTTLATHRDAKRDPQDVALQIYTSGTTGRPKGVMLTGANLAASLPEICHMWQLDTSSRMLAVLPLFHIAGVGAAIGTLYASATLVLPERVAAAGIVDAVVTHGVTNLVLASVLLQWMLNEIAARKERGEPVPLSSLRLVAYGAAPISQQVLRDALQHLPCGLLQVYGLTECVGTIAVLQPEDHTLGNGGTERLRSCGRPLPTLELRLVDSDSGAVVERGDVGEVQIRSRG